MAYARLLFTTTWGGITAIVIPHINAVLGVFIGAATLFYLVLQIIKIFREFKAKRKF